MALAVVVARVGQASINLKALFAFHLITLLAFALVSTGASLLAQSVLVARVRITRVDFNAFAKGTLLVAGLAVADVSAGASLGAGGELVTRVLLFNAVVDGHASRVAHLVTLLTLALVSTGTSLFATRASDTCARLLGSAHIDLSATRTITSVASLANARISARIVRGALCMNTTSHITGAWTTLSHDPSVLGSVGRASFNNTQASALVGLRSRQATSRTSAQAELALFTLPDPLLVHVFSAALGQTH